MNSPMYAVLQGLQLFGRSALLSNSAKHWRDVKKYYQKDLIAAGCLPPGRSNGSGRKAPATTTKKMIEDCTELV